MKYVAIFYYVIALCTNDGCRDDGQKWETAEMCERQREPVRRREGAMTAECYRRVIGWFRNPAQAPDTRRP